MNLCFTIDKMNAACDMKLCCSSYLGRCCHVLLGEVWLMGQIGASLRSTFGPFEKIPF